MVSFFANSWQKAEVKQSMCKERKQIKFPLQLIYAHDKTITTVRGAFFQDSKPSQQTNLTKKLVFFKPSQSHKTYSLYWEAHQESLPPSLKFFTIRFAKYLSGKSIQLKPALAGILVSFQRLACIQTCKGFKKSYELLPIISEMTCKK